MALLGHKFRRLIKTDKLESHRELRVIKFNQSWKPFDGPLEGSCAGKGWMVPCSLLASIVETLDRKFSSQCGSCGGMTMTGDVTRLVRFTGAFRRLLGRT